MIENYLYHGLCLLLLLLIFIDTRKSNQTMELSLICVYIMSGLIIVFDISWNIISDYDIGESALRYAVNEGYFIAGMIGIYSWMRYTLKSTQSVLYCSKQGMFLLTLPAVIAAILIIMTPFTGTVFTISDGEYVRGSLFFLDSLVKVCYLLFSSIYAFMWSKKQTLEYLKKKYMLFAVYCIPVILSGALQSAFGIDLNCAAPAIGLAIVYRCGLSNEAKDNADLIKAIAKTYEVSFIINTDTHRGRTLSAESDYENIMYMSEYSTYDECVREVIRQHVLPEDKITVENGFDIKNVLENLEKKNTYSIIYKVNIEGEDAYNKATFMKAFGDEDRHEIFLGVERIDTRRILIQNQEIAEAQVDEIERVKESFTNVIANIIEARDVNSGQHVARVKTYTQYLCNQLMEDFPEYGLNPRIVRYIVNGSALHDIGKIMIPDSILLKPGKLTADEFEIMKTHCVKGCTILDELPDDIDKEYIKYAKDICRYHHEKYDGNGYPEGLKGEKIPIAAQIVSLADCFDALTAERPYKKAYNLSVAYEMILNGECGVFSEKLLSCFKKVYKKLAESF